MSNNDINANDISSDSTEPVVTYWLNLDKLEDAKCLHAIAVGTEERNFKGIELTPATPLVAAAPLLYEVLLSVRNALDIYEAPQHIVAAIEAALTLATNTATATTDAELAKLAKVDKLTK